MPMLAWQDRAQALAGSPAAMRLVVTAAEWPQITAELAAAGGQLLAMWATPVAAGSGTADSVSGRAPGMPALVRAALLLRTRVLVLELAVPQQAQHYPGLQAIFPAAARMQRAIFDLSGVRADDADQRPWLRHSAWPEGSRPLSEALRGIDPAALVADNYAFQRVEGEGVHEVPVGPIHAGIIEPGHFRFSIVGEKVLRLEARLGYVHKGIERRFEELGLSEAHRLAARVSGDSAVAFSWAYCQACEALTGTLVPSRALWLRALCLEIERMQNHLGDLGALGNDAGFGFALAQFSRLKEQLLRAVHFTLGQRYLLDAVVPGGVAVDITTVGATALRDCVRMIAAESLGLRNIYDEHAGVQDRFVGAGHVPPDLARRLGLMGLAGRASGQDLDLRVDQPWPPYQELGVHRCGQSTGDVAARVAVRFDELQESARLVERILAQMPGGPVREPVPVPAPGAGTLAIGLIEGWRGPTMIALQIDAGGRIVRCHPHDCSWQNWPVLEHAIIGNIVPDFPLINKSFNLSYSGHDL